jgi:hypothetical protein
MIVGPLWLITAVFWVIRVVLHLTQTLVTILEDIVTTALLTVKIFEALTLSIVLVVCQTAAVELRSVWQYHVLAETLEIVRESILNTTAVIWSKRVSLIETLTANITCELWIPTAVAVTNNGKLLVLANTILIVRVDVTTVETVSL